MASSTCPNCRQPVAAGQSACPACGYPLSSGSSSALASVLAPLPVRKQRRQFPVLFVAIALIVVCVLGSGGVLVYNVIQNRNVLYSNAMTGLANDASTWPDDANCFGRSDGYHITAADACFPLQSPYQDENISVDVKRISGDGEGFFGIAFRLLDPAQYGKGNYYFFGIDTSDDWSVSKVVNSTPSYLLHPTASDAIHTGANSVNHLEVRVHLDTYQFFINGQKVGQTEDSTYLLGQYGLVGADGMEVVFTDFQVTRG
ncbi:MAG: hypothetical protein OJF49_002575 [Ktedonobacterales bacterium]|nr:MAG: hypothetical protein OJF49_002575 [Ktedonobacterales bacterium]